MGIRPEHLHIDRTVSLKLKTKIEVVEPLGAETLVYSSWNNHRFVSRHRPDILLKRGADLELSPDFDKAHFFGDLESDRESAVSNMGKKAILAASS